MFRLYVRHNVVEKAKIPSVPRSERIFAYNCEGMEQLC